MSGGIKHDQGKLRLELVPFELVEAAAQAMGFGAAKYGDYNWQKGLVVSRVFAALLRHLYAWWKGQDLDEESGLSHLAHAAACLGFLTWYMKHRPDLDDRCLPNTLPNK